MRRICLLLSCFILFGCAEKEKVEDTAAYQAACYGPPISRLFITEARQKAQIEGYAINMDFFCIDKASYLAMQEQEAKWLAANTPEAKAKREAAFAKEAEHAAQQRAHEREESLRKKARIAEKQKQEFEVTVNSPLRNIDVNTASEEDIASVVTISQKVASQIITARNIKPFSDWTDLINRRVGLSAEQHAAFASVCGLSVNGESLPGSPPDRVTATLLYRTQKGRF